MQYEEKISVLILRQENGQKKSGNFLFKTLPRYRLVA
jgi:hypothetical protein